MSPCCERLVGNNAPWFGARSASPGIAPRVAKELVLSYKSATDKRATDLSGFEGVGGPTLRARPSPLGDPGRRNAGHERHPGTQVPTRRGSNNPGHHADSDHRRLRGLRDVEAGGRLLRPQAPRPPVSRSPRRDVRDEATRLRGSGARRCQRSGSATPPFDDRLRPYRGRSAVRITSQQPRLDVVHSFRNPSLPERGGFARLIH